MIDKATHGGPREGAGRPKAKDLAKRVLLTMPPSIFNTLERLRGTTPRTTFIQRLIIHEDNRDGE